jgi:lipopolysaccharide/colanic/teichoic acid biosynthesis glycosyltransferase
VNGRQKAVKRAFDIAGAAAGLAMCWPIIAVSALAARRDTGASGIFAQRRIGRGGRPFTIRKIRTMRAVPGTHVTAAGDPRITPLGAFLRRTRIDELPQLWNVLKGDMSFVGPRPDMPGYADRLAGEDRAVLDLRPGITGPATLKYRDEEAILAAQADPVAYNDRVIWPDKVAINRAYGENWSLAGDLACIWRTIRPAGAATAYTPLIIVGAGRSGTNMLRDSLTALPGFATWDCDEINPVWRHGHFFRRDDELTAADLTPSGRRSIRRAFDKVARKNPGTRFVVEKTCANSLRLPFVDAALEGAIYIQIVRDGRDVVPSAAKRWRGKMELDSRRYFLAKARNTPPADLPLYAASFIAARLEKVFGSSGRLSQWGPRYRGIDDDRRLPLAQICARQWAACVERSDAFLEQLARNRWLRIRYEDFVADPRANLRRILAFLDVPAGEAAIQAGTLRIRTDSVGRGRGTEAQGWTESVMPEMESALRRHGYLGAKT